MKIRILGAHNIESRDTGCAGLLIDGIMALDAGSILSRLSFTAQQRLQALLLTHRHYDHVKDIPLLGMTFYQARKTLQVFAVQSVYDDVSKYLLDGVLYPDFRQTPPAKPALQFNIIEHFKEFTVGSYQVLAVPVRHAVPCNGYQITSPGGKKVFYTSDTGPGLAESWPWVRPDVLIVEVTAPNQHREFAANAGHLTPELLKTELESFRRLKGYLPQIVTLHTNPLYREDITGELSLIASELKASIIPGNERTRLDL
jgi:ribonuclease BN (tRNA processing enzyme)